MPKRTDIKKILLIGSGPIIIGQAAEFDYSGTQACKALREEGYTVVLVNSNPATIMTDPGTADRTYIEPITWEVVEKIIVAERPDALLPTLGGQTALNTAMDLFKRGILETHGVEMIGANADVIDKAEDRQRFKDAVVKIGVEVPKSVVVHTLEEAMRALDEVGLPCVSARASRWAAPAAGSRTTAMSTATSSPTASPSPHHRSPRGESVIGWKEYELEVMRDRADNVVIICSIENLDPMGCTPATASPSPRARRYRTKSTRDARQAKDIIREIGVETGGSNIQFAVNPADGRMIVIEMNPRVSGPARWRRRRPGSRSPRSRPSWRRLHARRAANDITRETPACFEPTIDYVVTKVPRFAFEKFPVGDSTLTTQMKSVGETMAIGRTFKESLQKALRGCGGRSLRPGVRQARPVATPAQPSRAEIVSKLSTRTRSASGSCGTRSSTACRWTKSTSGAGIDPWFLRSIEELIAVEHELRAVSVAGRGDSELMLEAKQHGFIDRQLAHLWRASESDVRRLRHGFGVTAVFKSVDTCAAEFEAYTPYYYSTYERGVGSGEWAVGGENRDKRSASSLPTAHSPLPTGEDEVRPSTGKPRIMILGGGPNRIGQGIEFDYCCCQAAFALRDHGYEVVMVNSNPETVSTDYDTSDHLFFEPLTPEDVLNIHERMRPEGAIVQFGGQTPLNLAHPLSSPACRSSAPASTASTSPRTASGSPSWSPSLGCSSRPTAPRWTSRRRCAWPAGSGSRSWCGRASCSAGGT
jgi:carbamoyl-phosphate synthase large subunit